MNRPLLKFDNNRPVLAGNVLISSPLDSKDRKVILIMEHHEEGSVGFELNSPTELNLGDLIPEVYAADLTIFKGGDTQLDTLHVIHSGLPIGGNHFKDEIIWGSSYDTLIELIKNSDYHPDQLKLFVGYTGWPYGHLEKEVKEGKWFVTGVNSKQILSYKTKNLWKNLLFSMGKDYRMLANVPADIALN